ncbi:UPF0481 protein-like protein, partial [Tanacetum coccineum]
MLVYDTDIEDVIEEEEGFVGKGGFGKEEENMEDIVVVANDLCSLMIQTTLKFFCQMLCYDSRKPHSNLMKMEMSESESVRIEIPSNQPGNNNNVVVKEWEGCLRGNETNKRKRYIQRVPPLLLHGVKRLRNHEYYEPAVVFEVIHDARNCYIDGSTVDYNDEEFNWMMLRDACFILFFIECISCGYNKVLLNNEYLGALGFANVARDIFLLENQIPFVVLKVLLELRFTDRGEDILNGFFNYLNYGE